MFQFFSFEVPHIRFQAEITNMFTCKRRISINEQHRDKMQTSNAIPSSNTTSLAVALLEQALLVGTPVTLQNYSTVADPVFVVVFTVWAT